MSLYRFIAVLISALVLCFSVQLNAMANTQTLDKNIAQTEPTQKVNLNSATLDQLKKIKGIGATKAQAIIDYRTEHGPLKSVDDLAKVKGFSNKVLASLLKKNPNMIVVE